MEEQRLKNELVHDENRQPAGCENREWDDCHRELFQSLGRLKLDMLAEQLLGSIVQP